MLRAPRIRSAVVGVAGFKVCKEKRQLLVAEVCRYETKKVVCVLKIGRKKGRGGSEDHRLTPNSKEPIRRTDSGGLED